MNLEHPTYKRTSVWNAFKFDINCVQIMKNEPVILLYKAKLKQNWHWRTKQNWHWCISTSNDQEKNLTIEQHVKMETQMALLNQFPSVNLMPILIFWKRHLFPRYSQKMDVRQYADKGIDVYPL